MESNNEEPKVNHERQEQLSYFSDRLREVKQECNKIIVGHENLVDLIICSMICGGHVLLEGVPGIAKTLTAKVIAQVVDSKFRRIQFTPDLLPSDIIGTSIYEMDTGKFKFEKGPIFSNTILIDEINRAPAKTQAALFEVMEERQITYDGKTYKFDFPFIIIATQNPIEQEGTYRLPEAQLDRFLIKIILEYPSLEEEQIILQRFQNDLGEVNLKAIQPILKASELKKLQELAKSIHIEDQIITYISQIVQATRNHPKLYLGGSPRASLAVLKLSKLMAILSGRDFVIPDDVKYIAPYVLNHRLILTPDAEMESLTTFDVINGILKEIEIPR